MNITARLGGLSAVLEDDAEWQSSSRSRSNASPGACQLLITSCALGRRLEHSAKCDREICVSQPHLDGNVIAHFQVNLQPCSVMFGVQSMATTTQELLMRCRPRYW
jgi:hypothetical protein